MPRIKKRKVLIHMNKQNKTEVAQLSEASSNNSTTIDNDLMYNILSMAQLGELSHNKYLREMQNLYKHMDHDAFMKKFITMIKSAMEGEEKNEFANTALLFCAKFSTSFKSDDTHPILVSMFDWLLSTISHNPHIRYRLCQFVNFMLNALGNEASLDDNICDHILTYMIERLRDINPNVRLQAILALQRLQIPDNPDDIVVKAYQFHLNSDPSSRVRQAVITAIGRNYNTIPYIIERLWDVDEKVRRHTYLYMSSYPVKAYKVAQRLKFLEQGLNDRSELVRKVVTTVLLPQWFESYNKNFISFISAFKLDANEEEVDRFRKITKVALKEMFKKRKIDELIKNLPLDKDSEFEKCVPLSKLSVEVTLYWLTLIEYLQDNDEIDDIIPELSVFCAYVKYYCKSIKKNMDKWEKMEHQYILLTLIEILYMFDLGDEIGREQLKDLLESLLKDYDLEERIIKMIIRCIENLIDDQEKCLQFFVDLINDMLDTKDSKFNDLSNECLLNEFLEQQLDPTIKITYSSLKFKILELKEQEVNLVEKKDYVNAEKITEELNHARDEYNQFLKFLTDQNSLNASTSNNPSIALLNQLQQFNKKLTIEIITKCLMISFYMIASKKVNSLTPNVCKLYQDFVRRYIESNSITLRGWALKCGTACSMLYEQISKDVFTELYAQFFKTSSGKIWKTAIECMFELLDRYGLSNFEVEEKSSKDRKTGRQLYNTLEFLDLEEETSSSGGHGNHASVIYMLSHFLDTCEDTSMITAIVKGFCRLILHDHIKNDDIIEKLLIKYFNPATDSETNQILGVFFENIMKLKKQEYLQPCLLPTITTILGAPYDSPLHEIKPEIVLKFIIDSTRPEFCSPGLNIHNTIALTFMQEMKNNISNRDLLRILSKELIYLEIAVTDDQPLRNDLKICCEKILQHDVDSIISKNIVNFKDMLDGIQSKKDRETNGAAGSDEEINSDVEGGENAVANDKTVEKQNEKENETENQNESQQNVSVMENGKEPSPSSSSSSSLNQNDRQQQQENNEKVTEQGKKGEKGKEEESEKEKEGKSVKQSHALEEKSTKSITTTIPIVDKSKETQNEMNKTQDSIIDMPTTYGKDNRTDLKYLRKSLNMRQKSSEDEGPMRPPKIRIEAKLESRSKNKNAVLHENGSNVTQKDSSSETETDSKTKPRGEKRKSNQVVTTSEEETEKQNSKSVQNQDQGKNQTNTTENQRKRGRKKKQKITEEHKTNEINIIARPRTRSRKIALQNLTLSDSTSSLLEIPPSPIQRTSNRIIKPKTVDVKNAKTQSNISRTTASADNRNKKSKYPLVKILLKTNPNNNKTDSNRTETTATTTTTTTTMNGTSVVGVTARKRLNLSVDGVNNSKSNSITKNLRSRSSSRVSNIRKLQNCNSSNNSIIVTDSTTKNDVNQKNKKDGNKTIELRITSARRLMNEKLSMNKREEKTTPETVNKKKDTRNEVPSIRTRSLTKKTN